jgi:hypothetical protein
LKQLVIPRIVRNSGFKGDGHSLAEVV